MAAQLPSLFYITDGAFSLEDVRGKLEAEGVLLIQNSGEAKFVPDDPTFPTTVFHPDGRIEVRPATAEQPRLDAYVRQLGKWLRVTLQPAG